eukprot:TRINITY_DN16951_c0_g1_i1.p1 TRINITY_DN16951_c0_g1~~TRINITY_DN16951_c0_g1_i1.p1  ORF type:complete len:389 (-),score=66.80 TRINITY_DN16951_c0_g1_i1:406-1572(-)
MAQLQLLREVGGHIYLKGFPADWGRSELAVFFVPLGGCASLEIRDAPSGGRIALVKLFEHANLAWVAEMLSKSPLVAKGMEVVANIPKIEAADSANDLCSGFKVGQMVELQNLRNQTDLNGAVGSLMSFVQNERRWLVRLLDAVGEEIAVPEENLVPVMPDEKQSTRGASRNAADSSCDATSMADVDNPADGAIDGACPLQASASSGRNGNQLDALSAASPSSTSKNADADRGKNVPMSKRRILYAHGLPTGWTNDTISEYFSKFGKVMIVRSKSKASGTLAIVGFKKALDAMSAMSEVNGSELEGQVIACELRPDPPPQKGVQGSESKARKADGKASKGGEEKVKAKGKAKRRSTPAPEENGNGQSRVKQNKTETRDSQAVSAAADL